MQVHVKLIATYQKLLPPGTNGNVVSFDVLQGTTVEQVMTRFEVPLDDTSVILLNGLTVPHDTMLTEGDTVAAFSAIAGG
jgi:molybdopterin converting factor small subunit